LEDIAEPIRPAQQQPSREARGNPDDKSEEGILQRDGSRNPEIILIPHHALGKIAVEPPVEYTQLGFEAAQDQKVLEYLGRLRHKIRVKQVRYQGWKSGM
jgi:hypothetical protein